MRHALTLATLVLLTVTSASASGQSPRATKKHAIGWRWSKTPNHYPLVEMQARIRRHNVYALRELSTRRNRAGEAELRYELAKGGVSQVIWRARLRTKRFLPGAAMVVHGDTIFVARHGRISTGCALYAFAKKDGKRLWKVHLSGIGPVSHSKWSNRVQLHIVKGNPVVFGRESGRSYVEERDAKTGTKLRHRTFRVTNALRPPLAERLLDEIARVLRKKRSYRRNVAAFAAGHVLRFANTKARLRAFREAVALVDGLTLSRGKRRRLSVTIKIAGNKQLIVATTR